MPLTSSERIAASTRASINQATEIKTVQSPPPQFFSLPFLSIVRIVADPICPALSNIIFAFGRSHSGYNDGRRQTPSAQGLSFIEWDTGVPEREVIIKTNLKSDKTDKYRGNNWSRMRIEIVKQNLLHIQCCLPCACRQRERAHHPYLDCEIGEVVWWDYSPLRVGRMPRNEFVFAAMHSLHWLQLSIDRTCKQNDHFIFISKSKLIS